MEKTALVVVSWCTGPV